MRASHIIIIIIIVMCVCVWCVHTRIYVGGHGHSDVLDAISNRCWLYYTYFVLYSDFCVWQTHEATRGAAKEAALRHFNRVFVFFACATIYSLCLFQCLYDDGGTAERIP